jgi:HSP20 family protein
MATQTRSAVTAPLRGVPAFFAPLQREFDRVMADFSGLDLPDMPGPSPRMDLREADGVVELTAELPGLSRDDVHIDLQNDILTISGEKKVSSETREKDYRMVERRYGAFSRSIRLPASVKPSDIKAKLDHGVLTVTAPVEKAPGSGKVTIPVAGE